MKKLFIDKRVLLELGILIFSFILFALSDWILIKSWRSFLLGIAYFLVLYSHAQLNRFLIFPLLQKKRKVFHYIILTTLGLLIFAFFMNEMAKIISYKSCFLNNNPAKMTFQYQLGILLGSYICIAGPSLFVEHYFQQKSYSKKELMEKKIKIDLLNKQLNPHFLFNTLNTIYGMSLEFPERTPDTIIKISDLLRYQVQSGKKEIVPLKDELNFIENYIAIEKERLGYRCHIRFKTQIDHVERYYIAPLIAFTFIENAFKHGTENINGSFVEISIKVSAGKLELYIVNSIPKNNTTDDKETKVGLENTKERLQLLYPDKYILSLQQNENHFDTYLKLIL